MKYFFLCSPKIARFVIAEVGVTRQGAGMEIYSGQLWQVSTFSVNSLPLAPGPSSFP